MVVSVNGVSKQGVSVNGIQVLQSLNAASETVNKGVFAATTLSAVDADLATGKIKQGETIFGFAGTVIPGGTETIENFAEGQLADDATYTPGSSGIFFQSRGVFPNGHRLEYYSSTNGAWYTPHGLLPDYKMLGLTAIGDGTNLRIVNKTGSALDYLFFRHYISTWTYERNYDADLAAGVSWTPGTAGFCAMGVEDNDIRVEVDFPNEGWLTVEVGPVGSTPHPLTIMISDGTDLRIRNTHGSNVWLVVGMRAASV